MVITKIKKRPIVVILVAPRRARELEFHLGLRSGTHQLTSRSEQQTGCSALSGLKEGYYPVPWPSQPSEQNPPHSSLVSD